MDQLSSLLNRFPFSAEVFFNGGFCGENAFARQDQAGQLHLVRRGPVRMHHDDHPTLEIDVPTLVFYPRGMRHRLCVPPGEAALLLCAHITFRDGMQNALTRALPDYLVLSFDALSRLGRTLDLLFEEAAQPQHGQQAAMDGLCEVLTVQLIRHEFASGRLSVGMLAGLADAGLSRALEAIHEKPAQAWSVAQLAQISGMSRSKFAKRFHQVVGTTPADYLANWRLRLAQALLRRNKPVRVAATEVGYGSQSAFTKAFTARFGRSPRAWLDALA